MTERILWLALFIFFLLSPLVVVPGYIDGRLFCTLYDRPKLWFIITAGFLLAGLFFLERLTGGARDPTRESGWGISKFSLFLYLAFLGVMGLSALRAFLPLAAAFNLVIYVVMGVFWVVLARLFRNPTRRWAALVGLGCGAAVFVGIGLWQAAGGRVPFLLPIQGPASTFGYRNPAGHFIVFVLPFLAFAVESAWRRRQCRGFCSIALVAVLACLVLGALIYLFLLACRAAFLVLALQLLSLPPLAVILRRRNQRIRRAWPGVMMATLAGTVLVCCLVFAFPFSRSRVMWSWHRFQRGGVAYLLEGRYYHWGNTMGMVGDRPLLGVGPGNFRVVYPLYSRRFALDPYANSRIRVQKAHNDYLQVAAECGIPALLLLILLMGRQFWLCLRPDSECGEGDGIAGDDWRLPLAGSWLAFALVMFFSFPMELAYSRMFFFFLLALNEARFGGYKKPLCTR